MKISRKDLEKLISEVMAEQRVPGESTALSEKARRRSRPAEKRQRKRQRRTRKGLNTDRRRRDGDEIHWGFMDADGDGDIDIVNMASDYEKIPSGRDLNQIVQLLTDRGVIDDSNAHIFKNLRKYTDPRLGGESPDLAINAFLSKLATDVAFGDETRLDSHDILRMSDLSHVFKSALEGSQDSIDDEMRRGEFMQENLNESKETQMSKGFGRNDIKAWFAQTLYEDFETSKPRKRRSTGVLTEATSDDRKTAEPGGLDKLKNILVDGTLAAHGIEIDQENEEAKALKADFDNIIMAALEKYPDCVARLSDHIGAFVDKAERKLNASETEPEEAAPDEGSYWKDEIIRLVASDAYDTMDPDTFTEDDFNEIADDFIAADRFSRQNLEDSGVHWEDVLERMYDLDDQYGDYR